MTVAGFAIHRIFPVTPLARNAGAGVVLLLAAAWVWIGLFKSPPHPDADTVLAAQQTALAHYVARDIEYKLAERTSLLTQMATRLPLALLDHPAQLRQWLGTQQRPSTLFTQGLLVLDTSGRTVAESPHHTERAPLRLGDHDYLRNALAGALSIGRPVSDRTSKEPALPMAVPVKDSTGKVRALLVGTTALRAPGFLTLNPQNADDTETDILLVAPQDQLMLASTQAQQVLQPMPATGTDSVLDRAVNGFRGSDVRITPEGIEEVSAIASIPHTGWFVLARHADAAPTRPAPLAGLGRAASIAAVLLLAAAGWWMWQRRSALV